MELAQQAELRLARPSGFGTFRAVIHMKAMYSEIAQIKDFFERKNSLHKTGAGTASFRAAHAWHSRSGPQMKRHTIRSPKCCHETT
jgi:hypothetical protein